MQRKREYMNDEVWGVILRDYIIPYRHINSFCPPTFISHKDGEPLLNKRLPDRLRELSDYCPDMKIDVYSHGLMLPKWRDRGRDFFAFLGSLPNRSRYLMSYHPRNHDNSINDYTQVIEYMRDVLQSPPRNVEFITVSHESKWVSKDMQEVWSSVWEGLPITVHCNAKINPWTGRIQEEGTVRFNGCPYADFGHYFFGVTGNIIVCCLDLEEEIVLGNVLTHSAEEMFEKTKKFYENQQRRMAEQTYPDHNVCADCYGYVRTDKGTNLVQLGFAK